MAKTLAERLPKAHIFLNIEKDVESSVRRFVDIMFGHPFHTPTKDERNMFSAKGISLRSADLSRQVGTVITDEDGDIIASGCNDVPKLRGGFYEPGDFNDKRDFQNGEDRNVIEKIEIIADILKKTQSLLSEKTQKKRAHKVHKFNQKFRKKHT